jgi:hypothetical protein
MHYSIIFFTICREKEPVKFPSEHRTTDLPSMKHNANHSTAIVPAADVSAKYKYW